MVGPEKPNNKPQEHHQPTKDNHQTTKDNQEEIVILLKGVTRIFAKPQKRQLLPPVGGMLLLIPSVRIGLSANHPKDHGGMLGMVLKRVFTPFPTHLNEE